MGEDLGDDGGIFDGGDDRQGTATTRGHCAMSISNTRLSNWAKLRSSSLDKIGQARPGLKLDLGQEGLEVFLY